MINYDPFWAYLADHGISTYKLINSYGVSKGLIDRMKHNKAITTFTINELCNTLNCSLNVIMSFRLQFNVLQSERHNDVRSR